MAVDRPGGRRAGLLPLARLVLHEAWHRRVSAALSVLAIAVAVAFVHVFVLLARAGEDETRRIQRDIGLNVVILPAATDVDRYFSLGFSEHSMPEEYIGRVADQEVANRLIPLLRRRVEWGGVEAMLTGIAPEVFKGGRAMKPVFGMEIEPGTLVVGSVVAGALRLEVGSTTELLGEGFTVARVLVSAGTEEDVRVYADLADAQRLFGLEGRLNEIQALECHCGDDVDDPLARLREELEPLLPDTRILRRREAADARRSQRLLAERQLAVATPIAFALCGLWIAVLAMLNVRERRPEIGVLFALGYGSTTVAGVFLGRAVLVGAVGALAGSAAGEGIARWAGGSIFRVASGVQTDASLVGMTLVGAPLFAMVASLIPAAIAASQDPAVVLRDG